MKFIYFVVKVVIVKDGKFLVLKKKGVEGEVFEFLGGCMNYGEMYGEVFFREVYEEIKL